ncbi:endonuclease III [Leptotrichia alba]|uniref:Endonuclease III n=1 Tax=Leptotrichia alba TaxID=3239304 RepID=A0AB39V3P5_9FUSO
MTKKERFKKIFPILKEKFGEPKAALEFETPYQLMVAVILSAQCTDVRVNIVTKELFKVVKEPADIREMKQETLEKYIKSTGFYKNKAKNIKLNAEMMLDKYKDIIPKKLEELIELPGVGRKTANVVLGELWNIREGIVVDTHVKRLSNRIGFVKNDNPEIIERELMKFIPKKYWFIYSHYLILHGRNKCIARKPKCEICEIRNYCKYNEKI